MTAPLLTITKAASASNFVVGQVASYTLTVTNNGTAATTAPAPVFDSIPAGLTLGVMPAGCTAAGQDVTCTIAAGLAVGASASFIIPVTPTVAVPAPGLANIATVSGGGDAACTTGSPVPARCTSTVTTPVLAAPATALSKTSNPVTGATVVPGQTIAYTLSVLVSGSVTTEAVTLTDTISANQTLVAGSLPAACTSTGGAGSPTQVTCTLAAGAVASAAAYTFGYSATVNSGATGMASNVVVGSTPAGGDPDPTCAGGCTTTHPIGAVTVAKALTAESITTNGIAQAGENLTYTITLTNPSTVAVTGYALSDTLSAGLTYVSSSDGGVASGQTTNWTGLTIPAAGSLSVTLVASVNTPIASAQVSNIAYPTGTTPPACTVTGGACVVTPTAGNLALAKTLTTESGTVAGEAEAGESLTYTITLSNSGGAAINNYTLLDTMGAGLSFVSATNGGTNAGSTTTWADLTVPANGTLAVQLVATVNRPIDSASVRNLARGINEPEPTCPSAACVEIPTAAYVTPQKLLTGEVGGIEAGLAEFGETLNYSISLVNTGGTAFANYRFTENVPAGATLVAVNGAAGFAGPVQGPAVVMLTAPSVPARGAVNVGVSFRIADAPPAGLTEIVNLISGGDVDPACGVNCRVVSPLEQPAQLSIIKSVAVREARIGDLVRYTVRVVNIGKTDYVNGTIVDTPPQGFNYVAGSMTVADRDNAFALGATQYPLNIGGIDVQVGEEATITYMLRVGAGVRHGVHANQARALDRHGRTASNIASAQVSVVADPMLDESLIMGTVFDDRDGDGWQDPASLTKVRVQGGFAPGAYIANSTEVDRGEGPKPEPDASSPLLHGIGVGRVGGRQSESDEPENHQVVIRQRLSSLDFSDDFVLTSAEGVTLRMDAAGNTRVEKSGDAAKGLNGAEPTVTRAVAQGEGGYVVEYVIRNLGIEERGIPGVRIASVEGLLIETDPYGRYHLLGIKGGEQAHGRNFVLKVDPSTLPTAAEFSTANPLVRRITPGLPVRFDFGVKLPVEQIGGTRSLTDITLGEVLFEPGKATLDPARNDVIDRIAAKVDEFGGNGELVLMANGETEALALERVAAVRSAVLPKLQPTSARALRIVARTEAANPGSLLVGRAQGDTLLGTVLFDTDKAVVKPQFSVLLKQLAKQLEAAGGGRVQIVGHADRRASAQHNLALGMRRARAVFDALAGELSSDVRAKVRVEVQGAGQTPEPVVKKEGR